MGYAEAKAQLLLLTEESIRKRLPKEKCGVLFSGGVDSSLIAFLIKKMNHALCCYTAVVSDSNLSMAHDEKGAFHSAETLGFELQMIKVTMAEIEDAIRRIMTIISSKDVVKVGVALPFYFSMKMAKEDGIRTMFSGLGSEELFAGYERHRIAPDVNVECARGLEEIYERDLKRDQALASYFSINLEFPLLDQSIIDFALALPAEYKLADRLNKKIIRDVALDAGIDKEIAYRKKMGAQYGSKFDRAISKLAKKKGEQYKSAYLNQLAGLPDKP